MKWYQAAMITKIISGGQTGADQGGLAAARLYGIPTGGYAPKNFMTTDGENHQLSKEYGIIETEHGYRKRTLMNIDASDCTIIIASNIHSPGTKLTISHLRKTKKPFELVTYPNNIDIQDWLYQHSLYRSIKICQSIKDPIINVAGNSAATCKDAYKYSFFFMSLLLESLLNEQTF